MGRFKWLYPGMRVKRWVLLLGLGIVLCSFGAALAIHEVQKTGGSLVVLLGVSLIFVALRKIRLRGKAGERWVHVPLYKGMDTETNGCGPFC